MSINIGLVPSLKADQLLEGHQPLAPLPFSGWYIQLSNYTLILIHYYIVI